jgi:hypothetical protein
MDYDYVFETTSSDSLRFIGVDEYNLTTSCRNTGVVLIKSQPLIQEITLSAVMQLTISNPWIQLTVRFFHIVIPRVKNY